MAALILAATAVVSAPVPSSSEEPIAQWRPLIAQASARFSVPEAWIAAVMAAESGGRTHLDGRPITSRAGAMGLMQVMPDTYADLAREHGLGVDPHDPRDNILAGAAYLAQLHRRFGYPGLFAAYNAGPARYARHLRTGAPLPEETRSYIALLGKTPGSAVLPPAILSGTRLFFRLSTEAEAVPKAEAIR
ncbi:MULTISPECIES: lytic transglycosylase domain-containing protein [unclassified Caulobacter]|jgi:soluble lytic murein transglycosylase-like protein|uniref:Lytic transglycosylase n=1 Tax=Caulobacter vibrioides TaxID=155892 RepID=A0A258D3V2_CAUVI|nr:MULTISPECIES: lytic transglycosylase domain-containing protein [unclassified Caulobacter]AZS19911.1 lytic transglycosylase domain-containing protein [Caulobacter sp. FWC26]OYX02610.1 MAG: lytic transglycosylase [Caulobacter vibrioides]